MDSIRKGAMANTTPVRWSAFARRLAFGLAVVVLLPILVRAQDFDLYRAPSDRNSPTVDLTVYGAPGNAIVQIRLHLGLPGTETGDNPGIVITGGRTGPDGSLVIPIDRAALRQSDASTVTVQAWALDEDGTPLKSNVEYLTARPTLHLLLESHDGSPLPTRVVEYDLLLHETHELIQDVKGKGLAGNSLPTALFDVQRGTGATFFVPVDAESTLVRHGVADDPRADLSFGAQEVVDVEFTEDQLHLMVLTRTMSRGGRSAYALHAIEVDARSADRLGHHSSGTLFASPLGDSEAWLVQSDDSRRVFVVIRNENGVDRIQQWVINGNLHEGCGVSPIRRYGEQIREVRVADEFLAAVNENTRNGRTRLNVFHLATNALVLDVELPGSLLGLDLWMDGASVQFAALTDHEGGQLYGEKIHADRDPLVPLRRAPLPIAGALKLVAAPLSSQLFVGSAAGTVLRIDTPSWRVDGPIVSGLEHGIRLLGLAGDSDSQFLYLTTPEHFGSPSDILHCIELDPSTGRALGEVKRLTVGGSVTQVRAH